MIRISYAEIAALLLAEDILASVAHLSSGRWPPEGLKEDQVPQELLMLLCGLQGLLGQYSGAPLQTKMIQGQFLTLANAFAKDVGVSL
jgi:hypothetical protein